MSHTLRVHSLQTLGCVDGPGLRVVVFCQGCPLRCAYCHNPDTRSGEGGYELTQAELMHRLKRSKPYFGAHGGVTFSGGEPLTQAAALLPLLEDCRAAGIHSVIDTAGMTLTPAVQQAVAACDMLIIDIKHSSVDGFRRLTGGSLARSLDFLDYCVQLNKRLWIRQVIVPGITQSEEQVQGLADLLLAAGRERCIERVELLPYHRMAEHKYRDMGLPPPLPGVPEADPAAVAALSELLISRGLPATQSLSPMTKV